MAAEDVRQEGHNRQVTRGPSGNDRAYGAVIKLQLMTGHFVR